MTEPHPHTILNVDDNEAGRYAKTRILQRAGYQVLQAGTGAAALRIVAELRPELIVLDVKLPDISGLEVCRRIKSERSSADIMVLQVSASRVAPADRVQGLEIGADAYLTEPLNPAELLATTRALLRLYDREKENRRLLVELRESEERMRILIDGVRDYAIFMLDKNGCVSSWNAGAQRLTGYVALEILNRHHSYFYPDEAIRAGQPADDLEVAAADGRYEVDDWRVRRDGSRFIANVIYTTLIDGDGAPRGYAVVLRDITERKLSELTRAWLASMVEHTMTAIIGLTPAGIIESWNPAAEHLFGFTAAEAIGQSITLLTPDDRLEEQKTLFERLRAGEAQTLETARRAKDGRLLDVILTVSPVIDARENLVGVSASLTDVTARKLAEEALWRSEERLSLAQDAAHVGIWDWDPRTGSLSWTAEMLNLYGVAYPAETYAEWRQLVHVDDIARVEAERDEALRRRESFNIEYRVMHGSGEVRWLALRGEGYYGDDGAVTRVLAINMDVNERKRAEEERVKFEALVESSMDYIAMADPEGRCFYLNPAGRALIGVGNPAQTVDLTSDDFVADESKAFFHDTVLPELSAKGVWQGELALKHQKNGEPIDAYNTFFMVKDPASGKPMCIANVARDIRERKRADEQLRESDARFRALADSAPVLICISGPEGAQFCNQAYRDFID